MVQYVINKATDLYPANPGSTPTGTHIVMAVGRASGQNWSHALAKVLRILVGTCIKGQCELEHSDSWKNNSIRFTLTN